MSTQIIQNRININAVQVQRVLKMVINEDRVTISTSNAHLTDLCQSTLLYMLESVEEIKKDKYHLLDADDAAIIASLYSALTSASATIERINKDYFDDYIECEAFTTDEKATNEAREALKKVLADLATVVELTETH